MLDPAVLPYYQRLTQNPDDAEALAVLWQWFGDRGQLQQLVQIVEQVAERRLDPTSSADLFFRAGQLWELNLRRPDRAAPNYRKAHERDAGHLEAIHAARQLYLAASNFKNAASLYEKELAVTADPARRLELVRGLADARARLQDPTGQAAALEEVIRLVPDDFQAMHQLAEAYQLRAAGHGGGLEDLIRAASLLSTIAQSLGGEHLIPYSEAALDAWAGDETAFTTVREHYLGSTSFATFAPREIAFLHANPESALIDQVRRDLAAMYAGAGQYDDAIEALTPLAQRDATVLRELADLYGDAGRVAERVAIIAQLPPATDPPQRLHDLREMAAIYGQQGDRSAMLSALREILAIEPTDPEALSFVDDELRSTGEWSELRQVLFAAARAPGVSTDAKLGWLRDIATFSENKLGDPNGAIDAWRTVLTASPDDPQATEAFERLLDGQERWDELARWLDKRVARETEAGSRSEVLGRLADLHRDRRDDPTGEANALHPLWLAAPEDDSLALRLIDARKRAGDPQAATDVLRFRAESADSSLAVARYTELAEHCAAIGSLDDALGAWQQICVLDPAHAGAWETIEELLERTGRHDLLLETLIAHAEGEAAGSHPARLHARAAEIARLLGDTMTAVAQAERALALEPNDEGSAGLLGDVLDATGQEERLLRLLRDRAGRSPDGEAKIETLRRLGRALSRSDMAGAQSSWEELRAVSRHVRGRDDVEALEALAGFAELAGDEERLASLLDEAQEAASEEPSHRRELLARRAELLEHSLGRADEALAALRLAAEEVDPNSVLAWSALAAAALRQRHPDLAATAMEAQARLTEDDEQRAALASRLAELCDRELGDPARTLAALELQYEADPTDYALVERLVALSEAEGRWESVLTHLGALSEIEGDEEALAALNARRAEIAEQRLGDPRRAFELLAEAVRTGDEGSLATTREVASRASLMREWCSLLEERAHKLRGPARAAALLEVSAVSEDSLRDPRRALSAALQAVVAVPTDDRALDRFDQLAGASRAVEQTVQAYAAVVAGRDGASEVREGALRGARLLESIGAPSEALDLALGAQGRAVADDALLDELERLAPLCGRGEELFIAFDRRRSTARDDNERFEMCLRAAKAALVALNDPERAQGDLRQALDFAAGARGIDGARLGRLVQVARQADEARPEASMRTTLVELLAGAAKEHEEDEPRFSAALNRLAADVCAEDLGLPDHAWTLYGRALDLWPADALVAPRIEALAERWGRLDELESLYQRVIDDAYDADTARVYQERRASVLADKLGRVDDAIEALRNLVEMSPRDRSPLKLLQGVLRRHKRHQDLLMALERELEMGAPDKVEVYRAIAVVWDRDLKNGFEAKDAWKRVLKYAPADDEARQALERLERRRLSEPEDDAEERRDETTGPGSLNPSERPSPPRLGVAVPAVDDEVEELDDGALLDGTSARRMAPPPSEDPELLDRREVRIGDGPASDDGAMEGETGFLVAPEPEHLDEPVESLTGSILAPEADPIEEDEGSTGQFARPGPNATRTEAAEAEVDGLEADAQARRVDADRSEVYEAPADPTDDAVDEGPAIPLRVRTSSPPSHVAPASALDALGALDAFDDGEGSSEDGAEAGRATMVEPMDGEDAEDGADATMAMSRDALFSRARDAEQEEEDSLDALAEMVAPARSAPPALPSRPPPLPLVPTRKP
jgi:tetratricopeptide (TPR) repeat protein